MNTSILYVNNTDPEDGGGGDRRLFEEAQTVADLGAEVQVLTSRTDPQLGSRRVSGGVRIRTVTCLPDSLQRFPTLHFYLARSLFPFVSLPILVAILLRDDVDIVVDSHTPHPSLAPFVARLFSLPVVALVHEFHDRSALSKYPLPVGSIQLLVQNFLRWGLYTAVIVPRGETRSALEAYGVDVPIHVVPNGIDFETYREPADDVAVETFDFFVVSRLVHRKGIDRLLAAMAEVVAEHPDARLGIAGSGPKRDELEALAEQQGIGSNVEFLGFVSEVRKRALLQEARVFVLPSRQEGFGIAVLEAMAAGAPVVVNDLSILHDLVPGDTNCLVDAGDADEFATAMLEVLETDEERRDEYGTVNRREAEKYSLERVGRQAESVYEHVC